MCLEWRFLMVCNVNGVGIRPTDAIREHALARLGAALDQYGGRVGRVVVKLADVNGPRHGGRDMQCTVDVGLVPRGTVLVRYVGDDMYSVISKAADSVKVAVGKKLERKHRRNSRSWVGRHPMP
jgi:ribosome-associated translation inhibitor RaiA